MRPINSFIINTMSAFIDCKSRATAWRRCPWAAVIKKVEGGYRAWEFVSDYQTWKNQK